MNCWVKRLYVRYGWDTLQLGLFFSTTLKDINLSINAMGNTPRDLLMAS
jgi:hypothetical protein